MGSAPWIEDREWIDRGELKTEKKKSMIISLYPVWRDKPKKQ